MTDCSENQIVPPRSAFLTANIINESLWLLCGNKEREKCLVVEISISVSLENTMRDALKISVEVEVEVEGQQDSKY